MQNVTVQSGQTLLDIASQWLGNSERAFELMILNGFDELTVDLVAGSILVVPNDTMSVTEKRIAALFSPLNAPASAIEGNLFEDEWTLYYTTGLPSSHG